MRQRNKVLLVLLPVGIVIALLAIWYYPSSEEFRSGNPFWNGMRDFAEHTDAEVIRSYADLKAKPQDTVLITVPYTEPTEEQLGALRGYVVQGGTLLIMDDFRYGNDILEYMGLEQRFSGGLLIDPLYNYKSKAFPTIRTFTGPAGAGVEEVYLNHATTLTGLKAGEAFAWSSAYSFLDLDDNQTWDEEESRGQMPVAASIQVERGTVILLSDPSLAINSMWAVGDNQTFVDNVLSLGGPDAAPVIDQSYLPRAGLDNAKNVVTGIRTGLATPAGISALAAGVLALALMPLWRRRTELDRKGSDGV